jgi:hypothetical protein
MTIGRSEAPAKMDRAKVQRGMTDRDTLRSTLCRWVGKTRLLTEFNALDDRPVVRRNDRDHQPKATRRETDTDIGEIGSYRERQQGSVSCEHPSRRTS